MSEDLTGIAGEIETGKDAGSEAALEAEPAAEAAEAAAEASAEAGEETEYEYFEIEVPEENIVAYLVDEDDNEVGFVIMEDGQEVEYFYADDGEEFEYVDEPSVMDAPQHKPTTAESIGAAAVHAPAKIRQGATSTTDKVINTLESEEFMQKALELSDKYKDATEATKEIREAMKDVKDTIDMFNPKKLFK